MPRQPVQFQFRGVPAAPPAEAASRRRLRALDSTYPCVTQWDVEAAPVPDGAEYEAHVRAAIVGGDTFSARGRGSDVLAALRVAFTALERERESEHENVQSRAA